MSIQLPVQLPCPPDVVLHRLVRNGLLVRSVWFPTLGDMKSWDRLGPPLYVRPIGPQTVEIGPHLGSMWAAVFSPLYVLHLEAHDGGSATRVQTRLPRVTQAVLAVWAVLLSIWLILLVRGDLQTSLVAWIPLTLATLTAPFVGERRGRASLEAGVPWLIEVLLAPDDEEDW